MGPALLPSAKGLVLSVMPSLDEEHGETFDAALHLVDGIAGIAGPQRFFRILLLILLQNPSARLAVLNVLVRRLPRLDAAQGRSVCPPGQRQPARRVPSHATRRPPRHRAASRTDAHQLLGTDTTLVVAALAAGLTDVNVLVQRQALELLTVHLPLDKR